MTHSDNTRESSVHLGKDSTYPDQYSPHLLQGIPRIQSRVSVFGSDIPFSGTDLWTAYELSWLNEKGLPQVRIAEFRFGCESPNIVESKSFKYYLNSLNQTCFKSSSDVIAVLEKDLSKVAGTAVRVELFALEHEYDISNVPGECVDTLDVTIDAYNARAEILSLDPSKKNVKTKQLYTNLLKTNCPVTGQPDWAMVWIEYSGKEIEAESFLKYIVSLRQHQDFHETSVEQIFHDVLTRCKPNELSIYARYTRRGGLDINPFRTNTGRSIPFGRCARQ